MRVFKTAIPGSSGAQSICDTIQHDGKLWLVPDWIAEADKPYSKPARLIGMSGLKYSSMPLRSDVDFVMEEPVPQTVLQGRAQGDEAARFVIIERPDIRIKNSVRAASS